MTKENLETLISKIRENQEPQEITPRDLANAFGFERRSYYCCQEIDSFLNENKIITDPNYNNVWIDEKILLRLTPEAEHAARNYALTSRKGDAIRRIKVLDAANKVPLCVKKDDTITKALTLMVWHRYSQLPVVENDVLVGVITWHSIAKAYIKHTGTNIVETYMTTDFPSIKGDESMLSAYEKVQNNEFVVVTNDNNQPIGIITIFDLSAQLVAWSTPYLLTEEVETQIRQLCNDKYTLTEVRHRCDDGKLKKIQKLKQSAANDDEFNDGLTRILNKGKKEINSLDDLTFGNYVSLLNVKENWEALQLNDVDKDVVIEQLRQVNKIRNELMHFSPDNENVKGEDNASILNKTSRFLEFILKK